MYGWPMYPPMPPYYGPPPNMMGGSGSSDPIRDFAKMQRMFANMEAIKEKKKEETDKKKNEKKPVQVSILTLTLLYACSAPILGPVVLTIIVAGYQHTTEMLQHIIH